MAIASNTSPGQIILSGDFTGTGLLPELTATGVSPVSYLWPKIIVDKKGRLIFCKNISQTEFTDIFNQVIPDATTAAVGKVMVPAIINLGGGQFLSNALQIDINSAILSTKIASPMTTGTIKLPAASSYFTITDSNLSFNPNAFIASNSNLGTIRAGTDMNMSFPDGTLNYVHPIAGISTTGICRPDNLTIQISNGALSATDASTSNKGVVIVPNGVGFSNSSGTISALSGGVVQTGTVTIGSGFTMSGDVLSCNTDATTLSKGIVQLGTGFSITGGVLSNSMPDAEYYYTNIKGLVQIGEHINVNAGIISFPFASKTVAGVIKSGEGIVYDNTQFTINGPIDATISNRGKIQIGTGISVSNGVISVPAPDATTTSKGLVQIGTGINLSNGVISVPITADATTTSKGIVQIGTGISVSNGVISLTATPDATTSSKGLVQIGSGIQISGGVESGVISIPVATTSFKGLIQPDNNFDITTSPIGEATVSAKIASNTTVGVIKIGGGFSLSGIDGNIINVSGATTSALGLVRIGTNISVSSGIISVATASSSVLGIAQPSSSDFSISSGITSSYAAKTSGAIFSATQSYGVTDLGSVSGIVNIASITSPFVTMIATGNITLTSRNISNILTTPAPGVYYIFIKSTGAFTISGQYTDFDTWPPLSISITSSQIAIIKLVAFSTTTGFAINEVKIESA